MIYDHSDIVNVNVLYTHPLAPEELQGGVDVAEVVWPPELY